MSRSVLLGALAALMLALVGACGSAETVDDATTQPTPVTTEPAPTTTEPAPTTTEPAPVTTVTTIPADPNAWTLTAAEHRGESGTQYTYQCPPGGPTNRVWGTDIYTDDSSVCSAAVHAGLITVEGGGDVTIEMRPGEATYPGTEANGVSSADWGVWSSSYVFAD
ncbi:MAG: LCCL domain-containing protein [Acidimicrobiia bacterium]